MNFRRASTFASVSALAVMTACSSAPPRDDRYAGTVYAPPVQQPVYTQPQAAYPVQNQNAYAIYGQVRSIDVIPVASRTTGGGAVLGAVLGAVVGNQIGSGGGRALATGAGAVGGAVAGNAIERHNRRDDEVFRVGVRFEDGSVREFDFQRIDDLRVGDRVRWENGQLIRS